MAANADREASFWYQPIRLRVVLVGLANMPCKNVNF
jgi:hypothetical protein